MPSSALSSLTVHSNPPESPTVALHRARIEHILSALQPGACAEIGEVSAFFDSQRGLLRAGFPLGRGEKAPETSIRRSIGSERADLMVHCEHEGAVVYTFRFLHPTAPHVRFAQLEQCGAALISTADRLREESHQVLKTLEAGNSLSLSLLPFVRSDGKLDEDPPFALTERSLERWSSIALPPVSDLMSEITLQKFDEGEFGIRMSAGYVHDSADCGVSPIHGLTQFIRETREFVLVGKNLLSPAEYQVLQTIEREFDARQFPSLTHADLREMAQAQFELAWRWRKYATGDERNHPQDKDWEVVDIAHILTATRITVEILDNWRRLGVDCFRSMRRAGEALVHIGSALPEKPGFTERTLFEGVPLKDGSTLKLPIRTVLSAAYLHHEGWMRMRVDMSLYAEAYSLPELQPPPRPEQVRWNSNRPDSAWLGDSRNFLGHCFMLGLRHDLADRLEAALFGSGDVPPPFSIPAKTFIFREKGKAFELEVPA